MDRPTLSHRVEYLLARGLEAGITLLPERAADRAAARIGALVQRPLGIRDAVVRANLRQAFPDADDASILRIARGAYRHLGRETAATLRLARFSPDAIIERTEVVGWEEFARSAAEGKGVVLASGHFGNWEIGGAAIAARGLPTSAIVKRQSNPLVNARFESTRRKLGIETIDRGAAPRRVPRALREGSVVGIVADQDASSAGIWVPFLGRLSSTHRGPALFALRFGAPVFAGAAIRIAAPQPRYRILLERVELERTGSAEADIVRLTAELAARLERAIRLAPEQYFWFHRRWKTPVPAELDPPPSGTTRIGGEAVQLEKPR
jgi:Kdo2-lipid IVA lauroyltransferase/acyltransferase